MKKRIGLIIVALPITMMVLSACNGKEGNVSGMPAKENSDPVTLTIHVGNNFPDEDFTALFAEPLKKKYPHITLEKVTTQEHTIEELIVAGRTPDIILTSSYQLKGMDTLGLLMDQTQLIKQQNLDLNRFDSAALRAAKKGNEQSALPLFVNLNALYYNKDIFDKFGVSYPKDGMTWDETIELAKKLSRTEGGIVYHGLNPESLSRIKSTKSLVYVDAETNKAAINSPAWRSIYEMMYTIYNIPNNMPVTLRKSTNGNFALQGFVKERNIAMWPSSNMITPLLEGEKEGLNWDMAQYPSYKETPNVSGPDDSKLMFVTLTSKHQADAMKVIDLVMSDEVQTIMSRQLGKATPLVNPEIRKQFMADQPSLKTKNIAAFYKSTSSAPEVLTKYEEEARKIATTASFDYIEGKVDLNTMIRSTEEKINTRIKEMDGAN